MSSATESRFGLLEGLEGKFEKSAPAPLSITLSSIAEFTVERGIEAVRQLTAGWCISEQWLNCIDYLEQSEEEFNTVYTYRVVYSIPTRLKPIPKATAAVYFKIKKSKVKPESTPVEIEYQLEGSRITQVPGAMNFQEKWLYDILKSKAAFNELVRF